MSNVLGKMKLLNLGGSSSQMDINFLFIEMRCHFFTLAKRTEGKSSALSITPYITRPLD